jgi:hypothetical protein
MPANITTTLIATTLLSAGFAIPLAAQETGQLNVTIGEASYAFPLWDSQSDWSGSENYATINIYARPTDEETWALFKTLTLAFEYTGGTVNHPELSLSRVQKDGELESLFSERDSDSVVVTVDSIAADGDFLSLSGNLSGALGPSTDFGRTVDLDSSLSISGTFDVTLGPIE